MESRATMNLVVGVSSKAAKSIVVKLGGILVAEYALLQGVRDDVQYISDELESMQAFLERLKRARSRDEQRLGWMKQVREVAYDIEDCVDDANHRLVREPRDGKLLYLRRKWYLLTSLYARHCIATEIRNLKVRAEHVSNRRVRYGVENPADPGEWLAHASIAPADTPGDGQTHAARLVGFNKPVGLEGAIDELKGWFTLTHLDPEAPEQNSSRYLAILGFGGLGKTTLAKALYHKFQDKYDCTAFVLASQKFNISTLLRNLIKQFNEQQARSSKKALAGIEEAKDGELKAMLQEQVQNKRNCNMSSDFTRYMIVVDDICSVSTLEKIKKYMPNTGGSILVTTRFSSVAEAIRRENGDVYKHKRLTEDYPYRLFGRTVGKADTLDLSASAKDVLERCCGGLPLAIVVVAGLVGTKLKSNPGTELADHLDSVDEALRAQLGTNHTIKGVTQILEHCYEDLPVDHKTCLLYCAMFPKGRNISSRRLMRRWIAEGFICEMNGRTVEEVAQDCFDDLISRNLIWVFNYSGDGRVKNCQIHDMVLQYIVTKSSEENFITVVGGHFQTQMISHKVRRLSIHHSSAESKEIESSMRMKLSHVRSLTAIDSCKALHSCLHKFKILQVLDLECCADLSPDHLKKICRMYQLKFLSLRGTNITHIPHEIGSLEYLEELDIRDTKVQKLPASVARLKQMAHLLSGDKSKQSALTLTQEVTHMTALETLSAIEVHGSSSKVLTGLERLTNLKKLSIYIRGFFEDKLLLSAIQHLSSCSLSILAIDDDFTGFLDGSLYSSEAPPEHLHTLELSGMLSKVPNWINHLHSLENLTLSLTSLRTDTLLVLANMPCLFSLTFSLDATKSKNPCALSILHQNITESEGEIFVQSNGFIKLHLLRFLAPILPPISFLKGAMSYLERLELRFKTSNGVQGLENLERLQQVSLEISRMEPNAADQIKQCVHKMRKPLTLTVEKYNE